MLPAGWEIEATVREHDNAPFLGALSSTRLEEARDERFVALKALARDRGAR